MSKRKLGLILLVLLTISSTPFFGRVPTKYFSAYAACRWKAINTEGYGIWTHRDTKQMVFFSEITFYDGVNHLTCYSLGAGPFWIAMFSSETLVGCLKGVGNISNECPKGYFGVSP